MHGTETSQANTNGPEAICAGSCEEPRKGLCSVGLLLRVDAQAELDPESLNGHNASCGVTSAP